MEGELLDMPEQIRFAEGRGIAFVVSVSDERSGERRVIATDCSYYGPLDAVMPRVTQDQPKHREDTKIMRRIRRLGGVMIGLCSCLTALVKLLQSNLTCMQNVITSLKINIRTTIDSSI